MRHSRLARSYSVSVLSLEVTEAEMLTARIILRDRACSRSRNCQAIVQTGVPSVNSSKQRRDEILLRALETERQELVFA